MKTRSCKTVLRQGFLGHQAYSLHNNINTAISTKFYEEKQWDVRNDSIIILTSLLLMTSIIVNFFIYSAIFKLQDFQSKNQMETEH